MRVLFVGSDVNLIGGKERYDKALIEEMQGAGVEVCVATLKNVGIRKKTALVLKVIFLHFRKRPDYVLCAHVAFAPIGLFLYVCARTPYVVTTHGIEVWKIKNVLQKKALEKARAILSVSNYTKEKILEQIPEKRNGLLLLSNAIDGKIFFITEKRRAKKEKVILTVSRLYPEEMEGKGILRVIEALPRVMAEFSEVKYVIVGAGLEPFGDARNLIAKYAEAYGVRENVMLAGHVSDVELLRYYNLADVFILPSKIEGFGVVFLEALACGMPVIAGNKDASREAILNGKLGVLVNPNNTKEIAGAIKRVLKRQASPRLYNREYVRREVLRAYGVDVFRRRVVELLHELEKRRVV